MGNVFEKNKVVLHLPRLWQVGSQMFDNQHIREYILYKNIFFDSLVGLLFRNLIVTLKTENRKNTILCSACSYTLYVG